MTPAPATDSKRFGQIDGLRGIAILLVVFHHRLSLPFGQQIFDFSSTAYWTLLSSKHGVDIFFVVSGFLIGRILIGNCDNRNFRSTFIVRRVLRIIPLYFLCLVSFYTIRALGNSISEMDEPVWSYFLFINNYFAFLAPPSVIEFDPYWSLAIEEQFYFIGLAIAVIWRQRGILILAATMAIVSPILRLGLTVLLDDIDTWRLTISHVDPIGIGILTAFATANEKFMAAARRFHLTTPWPALALASLIILLSAILKQGSESINILLVALMTASLILYIIQPELRNYPILSNSFLRLNGRYCFSIYILHQGFFFYYRNIFFDKDILGLWESALGYGLLLLICHGLWRYLEAPLIQIGRRWSYGPKPSPAQPG